MNGDGNGVVPIKNSGANDDSHAGLQRAQEFCFSSPRSTATFGPIDGIINESNDRITQETLMRRNLCLHRLRGWRSLHPLAKPGSCFARMIIEVLRLNNVRYESPVFSYFSRRSVLTRS